MDRFWSKVDKAGPVMRPELGACWTWTANSRKGYGAFWLDGSQQYAHRVAWELERGPIPEGTCVLHRCDNRRCVNHAHLFLGTNADNVADKVAKGRGAAGERIGSAKLTAGQVLAIRDLAVLGYTQRQSASFFGVTQGMVSKILNRKLWRHV